MNKWHDPNDTDKLPKAYPEGPAWDFHMGDAPETSMYSEV